MQKGRNMKVIKRYNQHRRDLWIDMVCENCGEQATYKGAYDDSNFWVNVVPNFKCNHCGKSSKDMGLEPEDISTKYESWEDV